MWLVEPPKDAPDAEPPVRPEEPTHPDITREEFDQLAEEHAALKGKVQALEAKLATIKQAL
jgi:hypothetical protein